MPTTTSMETRLPCPDNPEHNGEWVRVQADRPTLRSFTFGKVTLSGSAYKRAPTSGIFYPWRQRYFVLCPPFLYYFPSMQANAKCCGLVYLVGATVEEAIGNISRGGANRFCLRVSPRIVRKLKHRWSMDGPEHDFYLRLESRRELLSWKQHLKAASNYCEKSDDEQSQASMRSLTDLLNRENTLYPTEDDPLFSSVRSLPSPKSFKKGSNKRFVPVTATRKVGLYWEAHVPLGNTHACHSLSKCSECGLLPIIGHQYTCLACTDRTCILCSWCFYNTCHNRRHLFMVNPKPPPPHPPRVFPGLEGRGTNKHFRLLELFAFEALFRCLCGTTDGHPTCHLQKDLLLEFFTQTPVASLKNLSEQDLLAMCINTNDITFAEFMNVVGIRVLEPLMEDDRYKKVVYLYESLIKPILAKKDSDGTLSSSVTALKSSSERAQGRASEREKARHSARRGSETLYNTRRVSINPLMSMIKPNSPSNLVAPFAATFQLDFSVRGSDALQSSASFRSRSNVRRGSAVPPMKTSFSKMSLLEQTCVQIAFSVIAGSSGEMSRSKAVTFLETFASVGFVNADEIVKTAIEDLLPPNDDIKVDTDMFLDVLEEVTNGARQNMGLPHGLLDALECAYVTCAEEPFGFYTTIAESIHAAECNACGRFPIFGFRYHCRVCKDYDLCAGCFRVRQHRHPFEERPLGRIVRVQRECGYVREYLNLAMPIPDACHEVKDSGQDIVTEIAKNLELEAFRRTLSQRTVNGQRVDSMGHKFRKWIRFAHARKTERSKVNVFFLGEMWVQAALRTLGAEVRVLKYQLVQCIDLIENHAALELHETNEEQRAITLRLHGLLEVDFDDLVLRETHFHVKHHYFVQWLKKLYHKEEKPSRPGNLLGDSEASDSSLEEDAPQDDSSQEEEEEEEESPSALLPDGRISPGELSNDFNRTTQSLPPLETEEGDQGFVGYVFPPLPVSPSGDWK